MYLSIPEWRQASTQLCPPESQQCFGVVWTDIGNKISRRLSESRIIFYSSPHLQRTFSSLLLAICIQFFITAEFIHFNINLKTKLIGKKYNNLQCRSISSQSRYNFDTSKRCCPPVGGQSGVERNLTAKKQLQ